MFSSLDHSIVGRARKSEKIDVNFHNFRDFATNTQKTRRWYALWWWSRYASHAATHFRYHGIISTRKCSCPDDGFSRSQIWPSLLRKSWRQKSKSFFSVGITKALTSESNLGNRWSFLGDYVLTGGEVAAAVMIDATVRLIPDVLGKKASHEDDSFSSGLLEYPQYTRPEEFRGLKVPRSADEWSSRKHSKVAPKRKLSENPTSPSRSFEKYELNAEENEILKGLEDETVVQ